MKHHPFDNWDIQLPGRLWAVEVLLVLLLRQKTNARKTFAEADEILAHLESSLHADLDGLDGDRVMKVFAMARESLDKLRQESLRR